MSSYSVKKLARLAGVSVRTLHHYDQLGLLQPSTRTAAGYRLYGEAELLRLQQILFYKELDLSLQKIGDILDDPDFNVLEALQGHKAALMARQNQLSTLLCTIDKTILKLQGGTTMLTDEELYEGFPKEQAAAYRQEAIDKWGAKAVTGSENQLRKKSREEFAALIAEQEQITKDLQLLMHLPPEDAAVQAVIARHHAVIMQFWAHLDCPAADAYRGLAKLYVDDERYTTVNGKADPVYAAFISKAMIFYADTRL